MEMDPLADSFILAVLKLRVLFQILHYFLSFPLFFSKYCKYDRMKEGEMYETRERYDRCIQNFSIFDLKAADGLGHVSVGGNIVLKYIYK
jgi:hypothetical protein